MFICFLLGLQTINSSPAYANQIVNPRELDFEIESIMNNGFPQYSMASQGLKVKLLERLFQKRAENLCITMKEQKEAQGQWYAFK